MNWLEIDKKNCVCASWCFKMPTYSVNRIKSYRYDTLALTLQHKSVCDVIVCVRLAAYSYVSGCIEYSWLSQSLRCDVLRPFCHIPCSVHSAVFFRFHHRQSTNVYPAKATNSAFILFADTPEKKRNENSCVSVGERPQARNAVDSFLHTARTHAHNTLSSVFFIIYVCTQCAVRQANITILKYTCIHTNIYSVVAKPFFFSFFFEGQHTYT